MPLHRSSRSFTRSTPVTVPPVTVSAWSRRSAALAVMPVLNAIRTLNAFSPSCEGGKPSKLAVRGASAFALLVVQVVPGPCTFTVASDFVLLTV